MPGGHDPVGKLRANAFSCKQSSLSFFSLNGFYLPPGVLNLSSTLAPVFALILADCDFLQTTWSTQLQIRDTAIKDGG